jgi:uncharacterized cupin superfamily protein
VEHLVHWDDVEGRRRDAGHLAGTWFDLGSAAGSVGVGVKRIQVDPGKWSTPAHVEGAEEEIFFVLAGSGVSWQDDGRGGVAYEVREGDCLVHQPMEEAHTLRAGPDGLDVLAFGQRLPHGNTVLRRVGVAWMWPAYVDATPIDGEHHPYLREAEAGEPDVGELMERPPSIVNVDAVEAGEWERGEYRASQRNLGRAAGSWATGLRYVAVVADSAAVPPHCHSAEEELFVVLDGAGTARVGDEKAPVGRGHVLARPPGTGVAHALRAGGDGLTYLAYGTREPNDISYYPRSGKVYLCGVGVIGRLEPLDYWDGEA